jgi:acetoacetyl-CoA synthetase
MRQFDPSTSDDIVWQPTPEQVRDCQMAQFMRRVNTDFGLALADYAALWQWSVDRPADFWAVLWRFAGVIASAPWDSVLEHPERMPGATWFRGARLNFTENLLRERDARAAIVFRGEDGAERVLSFAELYAASARFAAALARRGIGPGDRVAAIMPNIPEAVIAMLGSAWVGATWSSCSPDFGADAILDRFGQVTPRLLLGVDGYRFKGRTVDVRAKVARVWAGLPGGTACATLDWAGLGAVPGSEDWGVFDEAAEPPPFAQLPFDHPLYILFSSGTTGKPKCIVHGAGGTLLQHLKEHRLHTDLGRDDRLFYFTTCGWMMWNWLVSGLASGATLVLYDGNPLYPAPDSLWRMADAVGVSVFGTSAKYLAAIEQQGVELDTSDALPRLRTVLSTGSPLAPGSFDYLQRAIKPGVQVSSISGGTDIVSCFALGNPMLPVRRGQLQCRGLGMAVEVFDGEGRAVVGTPGELVCTRPFPSMPVGFWNDADGSRYRAAYFARFPGVWTHGDWTVLTADGGLVIEGRSDAVLNPGGVRIGTAEIYRQVERLPEVAESVCVGQRWQDDVRVVLFVVLVGEQALDESLRTRIRQVLRDNASPRHVPAKILQVGDIPRTRSGKISELAVRDTIEGRALGNLGALANPEALEEYRDRAELRDD